ncbi:MAG: heme NO-binding domain-containing protein [Planctomycetes bacterium]|nr:heme NO-binding domain-containing protein [Planctomycetota bacterium]
MYGLVNQAIEELISSRFGSEMWQRIKDDVGLEVSTFVAMNAYDDAVTYALVESASRILDLPAETLLYEFGKYWTEYVGSQGYGELFALAGVDFESFLQNLDEMHARIALSFPELQPPSFQVERATDGDLRLFYYSGRPGLAPMVIGLIDGLAERFEAEMKAELIHTPGSTEEATVFRIRARATQG